MSRMETLLHGGLSFLPPPKKTESQTWGEFLHPMSGTVFFGGGKMDRPPCRSALNKVSDLMMDEEDETAGGGEDENGQD